MPKLRMVTRIGTRKIKETGEEVGGREEHTTYDRNPDPAGSPVVVSFKLGGDAVEVTDELARRLDRDFPKAFQVVKEKAA